MKEKRLCVFAHYDASSIVDDHVYYLVRSLIQYIDDLVFVSTCELNRNDLAKLDNLGVQVICRENVGYDFYSFKTGLNRVDLSDYGSVLLANDSVYGPVYDLGIVFRKMENAECDFWGISSSNQIDFHLQSYFLSFNRPVFMSEAFVKFWDELRVLESKDLIIRQYEIGLTQILIDAGFSAKAFFRENAPGLRKRVFILRHHYLHRAMEMIRQPGRYLASLKKLISNKPVNPTQFDLIGSLKSKSMPFIKIELLRDDPFRVVGSKHQVFEFLENNSDYPVDLIRRHLKRSRDKRASESRKEGIL